jgi:hypothetical protein
MNTTHDMEPNDEAELIRRVYAGDTRAFEPLVDRHLDHVRLFIALKLPLAA